MELVQGVLRGDRLSIARAISLVEEQSPSVRALLDALYPHTGQAHLVGITGSPGTGKSTLVNQLARAYRQRQVRVGVIAVDPTSPFSGGALLGDRIRMRDLAGDPGVFIRSMATRGASGGLATATSDTVQILDAAGYKVILIETVGVGQDEVAIACTAHTVVVVEAPGLGDDIQALKAGLMEIADIFVINKADREDADQATRALEMMLELNPLSQVSQDGQEQIWHPPICKTVALDGTGIPDVVSSIESHRACLLQSGRMKDKERQRAQAELEALLRQELVSRFLSQLGSQQWQSTIARIASRDLTPYAAMEELLAAAIPRQHTPETSTSFSSIIR
jgi:LAO/AO transport system kinase